MLVHIPHIAIWAPRLRIILLPGLPRLRIILLPWLPRLRTIHLPWPPRLRTVSLLLCAPLAMGPAACDHGFAPPDEPHTGVLVADVLYAGHPEAWPPNEELQQLLFVAMRFVPRDTTDFLQLNLIEFSDPLRIRVPSERVVLDDVPAGAYFYSGVAQKYGAGPFDWRPVGLVKENGGVFVVAADETTFVSVTVDFVHPPRFPPPAPE